MYIKHADYISDEKGRNLLESFIDHLALNIENRGRDATGFVCRTFDGKILLDKNNIEASNFIKSRKRLLPGTQSVMLHTRLATQGSPKQWENNHPVVFEDTFTTHNGSIRNDDELFKKHELTRTAEVDTVIIPALLSKFGLADAKEALSELRGGFATANIQASVPETLLLAKGPSFPLVIHDNKHFVVWASTFEAINKAWASVLGTAPSKGKFTWLGEGDMVWLTGDQVVREEKAFKTPLYSTYGYTTSHQRQWGGDDWDDDDPMFCDYTSSKTKTTSGSISSPSLSDHQKLVLKVRSDKQGLCTLWADKEKMPEAIRKIHNGKWLYCNWCKETVPQIQTNKSPAWGDICLDCYGIKTNNHPGLASGSQGVPDVIKAIDTEELEKWVDIEAQIHADALLILASIYGISPDAIEYILYRLGSDYINSNDNYLDLYVELEDTYTEAVNAAWDAYTRKYEASITEGKKTTLYVSCNGKVHKKDEYCLACTPENPSCGDDSAACGVEVFKDDAGDTKVYCGIGEPSASCPGCFRCAPEQLDEPLSVADEVGKATKSKPATKCACCTKMATRFIGTKWCWCGKHFKKCSVRGCKAETRGWTKDGKRKCHVHLRKVKGAYFDGDRKRLKEEAQREAQARAY